MKKWVITFALIGMAIAVPALAGPAPDSRRLALAKDYIADEQWRRAIAELRVVADDSRDANRDEALFWLAHSEHQVGDQASAIETIARLERLFPRSRWVRPARSLRVEIAQRLQRDDVLWVLAAPPQPAPRAMTPPQAMRSWGAPPPPATTPSAAGRPPRVRPGEIPVPPAATTPPPDGQPTPAAPAAPPAAAVPTRPPSPMRGFPSAGRIRDLPIRPAPEGLFPEDAQGFDTDLQIEALVGLLDAHSDRVIPLLRDIALDNRNPSEARRAVFALAQSSRPEARSTVVEAAKRGPHVVRIAAIRELGRFQGPAFTSTLLGIARAESDPSVRDTAIVTLGRTGARVQLRTLYTQLPLTSRFAVLTALFNAKDDDELIRIATEERDQRLRTTARRQLRLLATPKAVKFLTENP